MADTHLAIMEEFPLLSSWDNNYWTGFVCGQSKLVRMALTARNFPMAAGASLKGDSKMVEMFSPFTSEINKMTASNSKLTVVDLLRVLKSFIIKNEEDQGQGGTEAAVIGTSEYFVTIFNELETMGIENVEYASQDFQDISVKYVDQLGRKHIIKFGLSPKYPQIKPNLWVDLPSTSNGIEWPLKLSDAYAQFKGEVDRYVVFWSVLDELDAQAKVIDPVQPKRGDTHRRILLNQHVVVNLLFNPLCPKALPEIKISGPEKNVQDLDNLLDKNCKDWCDEKSILENLEDILHCEFMLKMDVDDDENNEDESENNLESVCVICCAYEFEENIPETTCECGSMYHDKCLSDLLVSDCSTKAKRFCVDCPVCGLELKVSRSNKFGW